MKRPHVPAPPWEQVDRLLALAIEEDIGPGDITTEALAPPEARLAGRFAAREGGVVAGLEIVQRLFARLDGGVRLTPILRDGDRFATGQELARVEGPARAILSGERLALNLLQRMSGVATVTRRYVEAVAGTEARILDTRKTMPGMRALDKLAVYTGGGTNHRHGLYDMALIKDNHLAFRGTLDDRAPLAAAVRLVRGKSEKPIMVEVDTFEQLREALTAEPDMVLLDNMPPETLREAVRLVRDITREKNLRRPLLEASGGVTLQTVRAIAETGVDRISVGALTHSARSLDIALDFEEA